MAFIGQQIAGVFQLLRVRDAAEDGGTGNLLFTNDDLLLEHVLKVQAKVMIFFEV